MGRGGRKKLISNKQKLLNAENAEKLNKRTKKENDDGNNQIDEAAALETKVTQFTNSEGIVDSFIDINQNTGDETVNDPFAIDKLGIPLDIYKLWNKTNENEFKLWAYNNAPSRKHCSHLWNFLKKCGWRLWRGKGHEIDKLRVPDIIKKVDEIKIPDDFGKFYFDQDYEIYGYLSNVLLQRNACDAIPDAFTG